MTDSEARGLITLTTDFGLADGLPAAMKAVIHAICPGSPVVDITHETPPGNVAHASFVLGAVTPLFPCGAVHIAVVDPGVGASRRGVVVVAPGGSLFVGPDNGLFSHVLSAAGRSPGSTHQRPLLAPYAAPLPDGCRAYALENRALFRRRVSRTFHGRDVFAPVGARLACGMQPAETGPEVREIMYLNLPGALRREGRIEGHVQHVDRFGNLVTDIRDADVEGRARSISVEGRRIDGLSESYVSAQGIGAIIASHGFVEVFVNGGSAAAEFGVGVGTRVVVDL